MTRPFATLLVVGLSACEPRPYPSQMDLHLPLDTPQSPGLMSPAGSPPPGTYPITPAALGRCMRHEAKCKATVPHTPHPELSTTLCSDCYAR